MFWCPAATASADRNGKPPGLRCSECGKVFPLKNGFCVFDESELVNSLDYGLDKANWISSMINY